LTSGFGSPVAALAGAAGIGLLAKSAFDSAVSFESLNARLEAITGSGDRAAKILETVRKVAEPSPFTFNQLATAATQLEAFGLKTEAILPRLANLGAAFGASEENLKSLVNLFGRLAAGNFPDIEQLSAFGLSKSMFAQQGIKFDAGGSLVSSARDTFDALLRIVDTKYATILDKMSKTTESKLASLQDKWEGAMRSLGAGLIEVLSPVIDYFTKFLDKLTTSGAMGDLVNRFLSPFKGFTEALTNRDAQAAVDRLLASVSGFVASIPTILQSTFENIAKLLENIFANIQRFMTESSPKTMGAYRGATDRLAIDEFLGRISHEEFLRKQAALDKRYGMNATPVLMEGVDFGKTFADTQKFIDGIIEKIGKANLPETATGAPKPEGPVGTIADTAKANEGTTDDLLLRIAKNTRDSADALTLRRETLGGGTMGAIGLTGAEVAAVNGSYGMFGSGLIPAGTDLERAMRRIIRDESRRNGQPGVMGRF
jgi:ABC-type transporter Mla subunit MlaD